MKTTLLALLILVTVSAHSFALTLERTPVKLEQTELIDRSNNEFLSAFLDECLLSIDSSITIEKLNVAIENAATGEIVYRETYFNFNKGFIDVGMLNIGEYRLQLTLNSVTYLGNFSI